MIPLKDENPTRYFPVITLTLVIINIVVFIYQFLLSPTQLHHFIMSYGLIPAEFIRQAPRLEGSLPAPFRLVTSQFVHGGFFHLAGNMLYLWIFGNNIEDVLGKARFLLFYLLCGIVAALAHVVINPLSVIPMVGASGAIAGVLGAYLITFPRARVLILIIAIIFITTARVPAFWVLGFWFVIQLLYALGSAGFGGTSVAYMAHVGGFIAGMFLIRKMAPKVRWR